MDCESIMGPYRLWIRKFARGNFGKTEKVLSAQAVFWMRKAIPHTILRFLPFANLRYVNRGFR